MAKMEAAAETDMEDHGNKRPAIQKLKILSEVEDFLSQASAGLDGVMEAGGAKSFNGRCRPSSRKHSGG